MNNTHNTLTPVCLAWTVQCVTQFPVLFRNYVKDTWINVGIRWGISLLHNTIQKYICSLPYSTYEQTCPCTMVNVSDLCKRDFTKSVGWYHQIVTIQSRIILKQFRNNAEMMWNLPGIFTFTYWPLIKMKVATMVLLQSTTAKNARDHPDMTNSKITI